MKKKYFLIIFVLIIFVFIVSGGVFFVKKMMSDVKVTNDNITKIGSFYRDMNSYIDDYNSNRDALGVLTKNIYIDNLDGKYNNIVLLLNREMENVSNVHDIILELDNKCNGRIYSDAYVNEVCLNYKNNYELMVNVFVLDVVNINNLVSQYNYSHDKKLDEYKSSFDYIDFNNDGVYSGKEEIL